MFPLPMQRIGYSANETSQSYKINSGKENLNEEKDENIRIQDMTSTHLHSITCGIVSEKQRIGVPET